MCDVYEEAYFCQKIFTNRLNMGLPPGAKKISHKVKTNWCSCKGKALGTVVIKQDNADIGFIIGFFV